MKLPEGLLQELKNKGYTKREIASLRKLEAKKFYISGRPREVYKDHPDPEVGYAPMEMFLPADCFEESNDN